MHGPLDKVSVPDIVWSEGLATGLADIDAQHEELFSIGNDIRQSCAVGGPAEEILADLSLFRACVATHFDTEEELMETLGVSEAHRIIHVRAHQEFVRHIDRITRLLITKAEVDIGEMLEILLKWLALHVSGIDSAMSREISNIRLGIGHGDQQGRDQIDMEQTIENLYATLGERTIELLELNLLLQEEITKRKQAEKDFSLSQMWIRTVADQANHWEFWQGPDKEIIYMSPSCEQITGYTVADFTANPDLLYTIIHPEDRHLMDIHMHYIEQHKDEGGELDFRIVRRDGEVRWIAHRCKAVFGKNGQNMGRRGTRRDRTDRYVEEESLRLAVAVFDVVNEAVLVTDRDNLIIAANPSFTAITGYQADEVMGKDPRLLADKEVQPELMRDLWRTLVRTGRWQGEIVNRRKNGDTYTCGLSVNSVRNDAGRVTSFVSVFSDISERKENESRISYLAHYDLTTGLPNRALFNDRLRQSVLAAKRYQSNMALMFIDLDKFKPVNDRFGHEVGDILLRKVAERIRISVRESDTAARIGGDEVCCSVAWHGERKKCTRCGAKGIAGNRKPL